MASLVDWLCFSGARLVTGLPVASGKAYFYIPGSTSTAVDIFSDPEETTPLAQPVTLDAAGKATVYCREQAEIVIQTSAGAAVTLSTNGNSKNAEQVVVDWDGTDTPLDTVMSEVEASLGAGGQYLEGGTNTVARDYQDVVKQFISPYDFGAAGNGTADDTTPMTRAIARAIATGLPLNLEVGTYKITSGLTAAGAINIYGAGSSKAIITTTATGLTGLTVVASGSYLRDFAVHVPYAGATYDKAVSISGSTCAVERLEVTGGMGIYSTAPFTRVQDCVVSFKCPDTAGAYGYGIRVGANSSVLNCYVNGQDSTDAAVLTEGIYLVRGTAGSGVALGNKVINCRRGGEGGTFVDTEFNTCYIGVYAVSNRDGAAWCSFNTCTTPIYVGTGYDVVNIGNIIYPTTFTSQRSETTYSTDATATPTVTFNTTGQVHIIKLTYSGVVSMLTVNRSATDLPTGREFTLIIQANGDVSSVTNYTWGTGVTPITNPTISGPSVAVSSRWIVTTNGTLLQITAWVTSTGAVFF